MAGADIIKNIRAKTANTPNPQTIYDMAQIPAPALPTPVNSLGTPDQFKVRLKASGEVDITWKCKSPRATGVVYQIWRRVGGTGEFVYLGGVGSKRFLDSTIPAGSSQVTYQIQAVRSTAAGDWAQFNVNFGMSSGGAMTATVEEPPKMAA